VWCLAQTGSAVQWVLLAVLLRARRPQHEAGRSFIIITEAQNARSLSI
jgi:hypothetical protein